MIKVENVDYSLFNQGIIGLVNKCHIEAPIVVEKETGELIKTLVRISPPAEANRTKKAIDAKISKRFSGLGRQSERITPSIQLSKKYPTTEWYASTSRYLFGISVAMDKRDASVNELRDIFLRTRMLGSKKVARRAYQVYPFIKRNTKQHVAIMQQTLVTKAQIRDLKARMKKNVGRLKAGWLVSLASGKIRLSASNAAPQWVMKHIEGARGRFEDGLATRGKPTFAIANSAKGITGKAAAFVAQKALNIRGKAMLANTRMIVSGKKNLADYARFSGTTA